MHGSCCGSSAVCKAFAPLSVSNAEKPGVVRCAGLDRRQHEDRLHRHAVAVQPRRLDLFAQIRRPRTARSGALTRESQRTDQPLNTSGGPASVDASTARPARGPPGPSESIGACCDQLGRDEERDASDACQVRTHCLALPGCQEHCQSTVRVSVPSSVPSRRVDIFQSALHAPLSPLATGARAHAHTAPPPPTRMPVRGMPFSHSRACSYPCRPRRG